MELQEERRVRRSCVHRAEEPPNWYSETMPEYKFFPGPTNGEAYNTFQDLVTAIQFNAAQNWYRGAGWNVGETSSGPWTCTEWNYSYSGGTPYFQAVYQPSSGPAFSEYYRFDASLLGTVDSTQWVTSILDPMAFVQQSTWQAAPTVPTTFAAELLAVASGNLVPGSIPASFSQLKYQYGAKAGQLYGIKGQGRYEPTLGEQQIPRLTYDWQRTILASDADDGTIAVSTDGITLGAGVQQVPVLAVQPGIQQAGWDDLAGNLTVLSDQSQRDPLSLDVPVSADAVADPNQQASLPGVEPPTILAAGVNLPAVIAVPSAIALLSSAPAIWVAGAAALGMVASQVYNSGLIGQIGSWLGWYQAAGSPPQIIADGITTIAANSGGGGSAFPQAGIDALERIADACERIADEVCEVPGDPTQPGITNAVELASQARSEITLRSHGQLVTCSTGSIEEVP
jgi:hypothetical protein